LEDIVNAPVLGSSSATFTQTNLGLSSVTYYGAAASAERLVKALQKVDGGLASVYQATHLEDWIGTLIGGNAVTGGVKGTSFMDAHSNYGPNVKERFLKQYWGDFHNNSPIKVTVKKEN
jgi:hypothetical protein